MHRSPTVLNTNPVKAQRILIMSKPVYWSVAQNSLHLHTVIEILHVSTKLLLMLAVNEKTSNPWKLWLWYITKSSTNIVLLTDWDLPCIRLMDSALSIIFSTVSLPCCSKAWNNSTHYKSPCTENKLRMNQFQPHVLIKVTGWLSNSLIYQVLATRQWWTLGILYGEWCYQTKPGIE